MHIPFWQPFIGSGSLPDLIGLLSWLVSFSAFIIGIGAVIFAAHQITGPIREATDARREATIESKYKRGLELVRIINGYDPVSLKASDAGMVVVACEILGREFKEYHSGYVALLHYATIPNSGFDPIVVTAIKRLVDRTKP